jgi:hypothetical protein
VGRQNWGWTKCGQTKLGVDKMWGDKTLGGQSFGNEQLIKYCFETVSGRNAQTTFNHSRPRIRIRAIFILFHF